MNFSLNEAHNALIKLQTPSMLLHSKTCKGNLNAKSLDSSLASALQLKLLGCLVERRSPTFYYD